MEQKTIGRFISILRKEKGMTQKDLAERLNVSDKSVSRWECDEGTPDLLRIPVIAEIFGVTCDELLCGERKFSEQRAESEPARKSEKQSLQMLKSVTFQYKARTCIAMGISAVGFIAALLCNLAFGKTTIGFLVGTVFFTASIVCQIVFLTRAMFCVEEELQDLPEQNMFKGNAIRLTEISIGLTVLLIGFTGSLMLADDSLGFPSVGMLLHGMVGMAAFLILYAVALLFVHARRIRNGVYVLCEKEAPVYRYNYKLQQILTIVFAVFTIITAISYEICSSAFWFTEKTTFDDYTSFVQFMEMDIPHYDYNGHSIKKAEKPTTYKDVYGNEIREEEFRRNTLFNGEGTVLCEYILRNGLVARIEPDSDADMLPITAYYYQYPTDRELIERDMLFIGIYCLEAMGVFVLYLWKRKNLCTINR